MPVLTVGNTEIAYTLRRSDIAKRARITVTPESVDVVVPTAATEDDIASVLHRRRGWLVEQTRQMAEKAAAIPSVVRFVTGAKIPYRGRLMRLTVEPTDGDLVTVTYRNGFHVGCPRTASDFSRNALIESALRLWLRKRLREDVLALVRVHGEPNGLKPKRVHIRLISGAVAGRSQCEPELASRLCAEDGLGIRGGSRTLPSPASESRPWVLGTGGEHPAGLGDAESMARRERALSRSATSRADLIAVHPDRGRSGRASLVRSIPAGRTSSLSVRQGPSESHRAGSPGFRWERRGSEAA